MRSVATAGLLVALAGCVSGPSRDRAAIERPPELLYSSQFDLPTDCAPVPGEVYRTAYVVGSGGSVERVAAVEGPPCLQAALSQWVSTFRYTPGSAPTDSVIDWMITVARK